MNLYVFLPVLIVCSMAPLVPARTIESKHTRVAHKHGKNKYHAKQSTNLPNRFCSCTTKLCKCCGDFNVPVVNVKGPGCASLQYRKGDRLGMVISFGDRVIANRTITGRSPQSLCLPLPTGVSKFCGRVYNIGREKDDFQACLGLELRSLQDIEASLRVSCFRFGPQGLRLEPAQPLPAIPVNSVDEDDDDDDDDDDDYDFDDDEDDDDDDEEEEESENTNDLDSIDYGTFALDDDFVGNLFVESGNKKKPQKRVSTTTKPTVTKIQKRTRKPTAATTAKPIIANQGNKIASTVKPALKLSTPVPAVVAVPAATTIGTTQNLDEKQETATNTIAQASTDASTTNEVTKVTETVDDSVKYETVPIITPSSAKPVATQETPAETTNVVTLAATATSTKVEDLPTTSNAATTEQQLSTVAKEEQKLEEATTEQIAVTETSTLLQEIIKNATTSDVKETTEEALKKKKEDDEEDYLDIVDDDIDSKESEEENDDDDDDDDDDPMSPITSVVAEVFDDDDDEKKKP